MIEDVVMKMVQMEEMDFVTRKQVGHASISMMFAVASALQCGCVT